MTHGSSGPQLRPRADDPPWRRTDRSTGARPPCPTSRGRRRFATGLGVAASHERRRFLMPRLDELDLVGGTIERTEDAVDAVARVAVNATHAPSCEASDESVGYFVGHDG